MWLFSFTCMCLWTLLRWWGTGKGSKILNNVLYVLEPFRSNRRWPWMVLVWRETWLDCLTHWAEIYMADNFSGWKMETLGRCLQNPRMKHGTLDLIFIASFASTFPSIACWVRWSSKSVLHVSLPQVGDLLHHWLWRHLWLPPVLSSLFQCHFCREAFRKGFPVSWKSTALTAWLACVGSQPCHY